MPTCIFFMSQPPEKCGRESETLSPHSPSEMTGVQTLLLVMLDHVHAGRLSLQRLVDLAGRWTIGTQWIASRSGWTPDNGKPITGWPIHTVIRGQMAVRDEAEMDTPKGQPIGFLESPEKRYNIFLTIVEN